MRLTISSVSRLVAITIALASSLSVLATVAHADDYDYTIGSDARAFAMGGVGLAFTRNVNSGERRFNPASLAFTPKGFDFYSPSVSVRSDGAVSQQKAYEYIFSGADASRVDNLVRSFSQEDSVFGTSIGLGFRVGSLEILADATAKARILPNSSLTQWAQGGSNLNTVPQDGFADVIAAGYVTLPSIAYAVKVPMGSKASREADPNRGYDGSVGLRVKVMQTYYSRYIADQNVVRGSVDALKAPEMNGKDYLKKTGVSADLGFLMRPRAGKGLTGALVINNLIKPGSDFRAFNSGIQNYSGRINDGQEFKVQQTTISLGTAYETGGLSLGADLMDISSATRPVDLRLGGEQKLGRFGAVRGGYSSNTGVSFGFGFFGIDVAFAERLPLEVNKTIRF